MDTGNCIEIFVCTFWERTYPPPKGSLEDDFPFPKLKYFGSHGVDINMIYNDCIFIFIKCFAALHSLAASSRNPKKTWTLR